MVVWNSILGIARKQSLRFEVNRMSVCLTSHWLWVFDTKYRLLTRWQFWVKNKLFLDTCLANAISKFFLMCTLVDEVVAFGSCVLPLGVGYRNLERNQMVLFIVSRSFELERLLDFVKVSLRLLAYQLTLRWVLRTTSALLSLFVLEL